MIQETPQAVPAPSPAVPAAPAAPAKSGVNKGLIIGIIAGISALMFLGLLVVICVIIGSGKGYEKPIKNMVKVMNSRTTDVDKYIDELLPGFISDAYHDAVPILKEWDEFEDALDEGKDYFEEGYEDLSDAYGKKWKVTYKILDKEQLDKKELKEIKSKYKDLKYVVNMLDEGSEIYEILDEELKSKTMDKYDKLLSSFKKDLKNIEITDGYVLDVELTVEGEDDFDDSEATIYVIKLNGKWVIDITSGDMNYIFYNLTGYLY